ncbi:MAG: zinc ribbon domain-containing protein [Polyangiaceae bacterium]
MSYALDVARLLACPFCRSLFPSAEARQCPECGVKLVPMENLPESLDVAADEHEAGEIVLPEQRPLPWNYFGRNRGALLLVALIGLGLFFAPWVELRMPEESVRSGFDLARGRAGWLWGGAAGWLVTLPLVWTRRTIQRLRGVRLVTALFAAMTLIEAGMLLSTPPQTSHHVPLELVWRWGIYASLVNALLGILTAARLGGDLQHLPRIVTDIASPNPRETSSGETLH